MQVKQFEFIPTEDGGYFKETIYEKYVPEEGKRHKRLCEICGWSTYPECRKTCQHQGEYLGQPYVPEESE